MFSPTLEILNRIKNLVCKILKAERKNAENPLLYLLQSSHRHHHWISRVSQTSLEILVVSRLCTSFWQLPGRQEVGKVVVRGMANFAFMANNS